MNKLACHGVSKAAYEALEKLARFFLQQPALLIAFSGGMDSSFLALAAHRYKPDGYRTVLVNSPFLSAEEIRIARLTATRYDLKFAEVAIDQMSSPEVAQNSTQRCYYCKKMIFSQLIKLLRADEILCEGSVTDDDNDHRPGKIAIKELKVRSPLHECGFSKAIIAEILKEYDAAELVRPGQSCLATRITTGMQITHDKLAQIASGEELLRQAGLAFCRLRHHGNLARIETAPGEKHLALDIADVLEGQLKKLGFKFICIDTAGYRKGSMNE